MIDTAPILDSQQALASPVLERIPGAAQVAASWDVVHRPVTAGIFPARVRSAQNKLRRLETDLASRPIPEKATVDAGSASQGSSLIELQENFRLLRSAVTAVSDSLKVIAELPRIVFDERP